ncbi:hypothetical protein [Mesorhizobium sp. M0802]|uniref:hypothetical protein n=1 Tax=Mesorhizobium sp. M0802 TaxID=2957001 RepID=UPI00333DF600
MIGDAENPDWIGAFRDLLNDLEVACAAYLDSQFSGRTGKLAEFLISDMLKMFQDEASLQSHLEMAIHNPETFVNIRDFLALRK